MTDIMPVAMEINLIQRGNYINPSFATLKKWIFMISQGQIFRDNRRIHFFVRKRTFERFHLLDNVVLIIMETISLFNWNNIHDSRKMWHKNQI